MPRLPDGRYRFDSLEELPPVAVSLGSTAWNRTGDWRSREPVFADQRPPCTHGCPTEQDIVDQLRLCAQGRIREAGELLLSANPFPATTGRVCPHPCTASCNRGQMDGVVDIPGVEAAIGDELISDGFVPARRPRVGGRVAVVGAGPAGMTAAHYLALAGLEVVLYDRDERPGGLLRTGIPPYRLPRRALDAEIDRALRCVEFVGQRALGRDLQLGTLKQEHDAVLVAVGRHAPRPLGLEGEGSGGVHDGLGLLAELHRGQPAPAGKRVVVIGGGNTAMDCARSLLRAGRSVGVFYRRDRASMPAFVDEVEEALEEGVKIEEWVLPEALLLEGGKVRAIRFVRARPGAPDSSGRPRPEPIPSSGFVVEADLVVVAAGEVLDAGPFEKSLLTGGFVAADATLETRMPGVWASGDCLGGGGTVAEAIAQGRRTAAAIARKLGVAGPEPDLLAARGAGADVIGFDRIRPHYFAAVPAVPRSKIDVQSRLGGGEVRVALAHAQASAAAVRCLSCGTCTGCDNCFQFCPDQAVVRDAPGRYRADVARCKGCGICVTECPRGACVLHDLGENG
ncbi:MAG: FAD-dependent oxidoreductase [Deltaproteobacteria bacterium]|nr:FAD-dependent oxidoreductase [Deltaproteobacteria bacterium]